MTRTLPKQQQIDTTKIAIFRQKEIRRTIYKNEWWFVIVDVVAVLTDSVQPDGYLKDMRRRDLELSKGWGQIATPLSIDTSGGKQNMNCANAEGIQEIEDPELVHRKVRPFCSLVTVKPINPLHSVILAS